MEAAEALGPPQTIEAGASTSSCAERVVQAAEKLEAQDYETALSLLLGDSSGSDGDGNGDGDGGGGANEFGLNQREQLGLVPGTLGAAVPAMVAEGYEGLALLVRADYEKGETDEAKAAALKHYEAAAPFLAAALPSLHPVAVHNPRLSEPPAIAMLRCLSAVAVSELWRSGRRACTHSLLLARWLVLCGGAGHTCLGDGEALSEPVAFRPGPDVREQGACGAGVDARAWRGDRAHDRRVRFDAQGDGGEDGAGDGVQSSDGERN